MKNLIVLFTTFIHSNYIYIYMNEYGFRTSPNYFLFIKNKQSFHMYINKNKKLIYKHF